MAPETPMESTRIQIIKKRPAYTDILDFYVQVFQAQEENRQQVLMDPISIGRTLLEKKIHHDMPLIDPTAFEIDQNAAVRLMTTLCDIAQIQDCELSRAAVSLQSAVRDSRIDPGPVFDALLKGDRGMLSNFSTTIGIRFEHLVMFTYLSIAPAVELCAEQLAGYLEDRSHAHAYCPVCGNFPDLFFLDEKGSRHLKCSFCSHCWEVPRMGCLFCDSRDPELHPYFFSPEEKEYRVDVCDDFRKYIKGVDVRCLDRPFFPKIELVATQHLDIKAREAGYTSLPDQGP